MGGSLSKMNCPACSKPFNKIFLFYRTVGGPICSVLCPCGKRIFLPLSIFLLSLFIWFISSSLIAYGGIQSLLIFFPKPLSTVIVIFIFVTALIVGGFVASQVILRWIAKQNGIVPSPGQNN